MEEMLWLGVAFWFWFRVWRLSTVSFQVVGGCVHSWGGTRNTSNPNAISENLSPTGHTVMLACQLAPFFVFVALLLHWQYCTGGGIYRMVILQSLSHNREVVLFFSSSPNQIIGKRIDGNTPSSTRNTL